MNVAARCVLGWFNSAVAMGSMRPITCPFCGVGPASYIPDGYSMAMCTTCLCAEDHRVPELMRVSRRARAWRALCRGVEASREGVVIAVFADHNVTALIAEFLTRM